MSKNLYSVKVKFGHVGKNKFIIKTIPIEAENGKEAAKIARWHGRVKHHVKDAILEVNEIGNEEYEILKETTAKDPYFHCSNIQEQREICIGLEDEIQYVNKEDFDYELNKENRKNKAKFKSKKERIRDKDDKFLMRNYELALSY